MAQNLIEAEKWFRASAEKGDVQGQMALAQLYLEGQGVDQNFVEAVRWFKKAAEQGQPLAQINLGLMYANGDGVDQDIALAYMWISIAAANGLESAKSIRDDLAKSMDALTIEKAQKLKDACIGSNYHQCEWP